MKNKIPKLIRSWLSNKELKWNKYDEENLFFEKNGETHTFTDVSTEKEPRLKINYINKKNEE